MQMSSGPALAYSAATSKVAPLVEDPRVEELELGVVRGSGRAPRPAAARRERPPGGTCRAALIHEWVGVESSVEMAFLDVLAVVALLVRQAEEPLLEERVPAVPERQGEAQAALAVGDPEEAVLAPAVGAASGRARG
jgi:hypothetical protein